MNNGGCSHLCLLSPSKPGYVCACPIGTMLMEGSNTTCYDTPQTMQRTISRSRLDGSEQSVVIHSGGMPDSIAIDALARNIYWTDPITDTINIARLDGTSKKVIIHEDLYDPRAIALHPTAGWNVLV
ncbi:hypothetical protein ACJJTC_007077 [Scirpophaga incertulas]